MSEFSNFESPSTTQSSSSDDSFSIKVTAEQAGDRIDRLLSEQNHNLSRSRIKALIEEGHLLCNGTVKKDPSLTAREGMTLTLDIPPPEPARPQAEAIELAILFEDRDLIVLDKPAGLVVHPAPGNETGTLVNALLGHCGPEFEGIGGEKRPGIVHRLDKDTSGVMVVAKTPLAHQFLSDAFANRTINRSYRALVWGLMPPEGQFEGAIGRDKKDRKRMAVVQSGGKHALTHFKTLSVLQGCISLIECRLATGRTHQIRVHLSHNGHPLLGDPVYLRRIPSAARSLDKTLRAECLDFPRQALHAASLGFLHPRSGAEMEFTSPLPPDFSELLNALSEK